MSSQDLVDEESSYNHKKAKQLGDLVIFVESERDKRMTLEDLQLTVTEQLNLKSCDKAFRHALWKSGEHICLTAIPECCRKTAVTMREYQRGLTLSKKNELPFDVTMEQRVEEKSKQYFQPR